MTTKLTDTQLVILSTAFGRDDRAIFPITASVKGGALNKVLTSLLAKALIEEVPADAGSTVWRDEDEGPLTLRATHAAAVALGIETEPETPGPAAAPKSSSTQGTEEEALSEPAPKASPGRKNAKGANGAAAASSPPRSPRRATQPRRCEPAPSRRFSSTCFVGPRARPSAR